MVLAKQKKISVRPKRKYLLAIAVAGLVMVIVWYAIPGKRLASTGAACESNQSCHSGICLPDADAREVANYLEIAKAYEMGRHALPGMGQIDELLEKLPGSSLTLRRKYPGVCTLPCILESDCPAGMFCTQVVWEGVIQGFDLGRVKVCMPDEHPAARLKR